jgi:hypothetical protein
MNLKPLLLIGVCFLLANEETVCVHPTRGESRRVSLDDVRRAQSEVKKKLSFVAEKATRLSIDAPFDSGLPACRRRETRVVRTSVPPELVGKSILFAASDRLGRADVRVATSARKLGEIDADALAHPALAERLGVRCAPTLVRARSEVELELVENP